MKKLLILFVMLIAVPAMASEVSVTTLDQYQKKYKWDGMTSATDSAEALTIEEGCYEFQLEGTYDAQITVQHKTLQGENFVNVDVDEAPDGLFFTSATKALSWFSAGQVDLRFDSAGGATMDANLIITRLRKDC